MRVAASGLSNCFNFSSEVSLASLFRRFTTPEEDAAAAALQSAFEKVRKELGRVAEAAIKDTGERPRNRLALPWLSR